MKTRLYTHSKKYSNDLSLEFGENETPADKAFPKQADIQLYESLFWSTFKDLPDACRQVLILQWKDLNLQEISKELNTCESHAKVQKCTCTKKFVDLVKSHKDYELLSYTTTALNPQNTDK